MALTQITAERTYSYSHNVGMLTAFSGSVDMALGDPGHIFVSCRASEPGTRPGRGQGWVHWNLEADTLILQVRSQDSGEREIVWPSALVLDNDGGRVLQADEWRNRISTYTTEGEYLGSWGTAGPDPGQLDGPSGMRFDPDGNLVISESRNNRIQRFDREGRHLETWGETGSAPGQLDMPYGIHVDDDGSVYVADWGNDRVQKFSSDGECLAIFGASPTGVGSLTRPTGVAVDRDGDVYVADCGNNRVQIYSAGGEYITGLYGDARTLSKSAQLYVDVNPNMAKARMRADTSKEWRFFRPTAVAIDPNDMILIAEAIPGRIQFYEKDTDYMDPQFNL